MFKDQYDTKTARSGPNVRDPRTGPQIKSAASSDLFYPARFLC
jgi:hypothetical protein